MARPIHRRSRKRGRNGEGNACVRRYPYLGKFEGESILALFVYDMSLNGFADETVSLGEGCSSFDLFKGAFTNEELKAYCCEDFSYRFLNKYERRYMQSMAGAILQEDSNGFVYLTLYKDEKVLMKRWAEIEDMEKSYLEHERDYSPSESDSDYPD